MSPEETIAVNKLVKMLMLTERQPRENKHLIPNVPVLTRRNLQECDYPKTEYKCTSSGSTGEPVTVYKSVIQHIWLSATNIRELLWRKWDLEHNLAVITARVITPGRNLWSPNTIVFNNRHGVVYGHPVKGDLQKFIDEVDAGYLFSYPSIIKRYDTSKFIDIKSTGEQGATMYSSEELGTIGITCPDNPDVYHIMENIVIEIDDENNIIATDITHPYLKRYLTGDKGEFARCDCGRQLQTISRTVIGRTRNTAMAPDGSLFWPKVGSIKFNQVAPNLKQFQVVQSSLKQINLKVEGAITPEEEVYLLRLIKDNMGPDYEYRIIHVDGFPAGKFEEFIRLI